MINLNINQITDEQNEKQVGFFISSAVAPKLKNVKSFSAEDIFLWSKYGKKVF